MNSYHEGGSGSVRGFESTFRGLDSANVLRRTACQEATREELSHSPIDDRLVAERA